MAKLGPKAYEQCAGCMRIQGGDNPLDGTSVHPESYEAAERLLMKQGFKPEDIDGGKLTGLSLTIKNYKPLAEELGIGEITLKDIVKELEKPARDPRDEMPKPILRTDVLEMKDLTEGMILKGTVRNVIDFGVFVDIGVHQDGLVHISEITDKKFIKHPLEVVSVGDIVDVKITGIQPYGAFASLPDNSTGLIHISEISDKFVKSIDSFVKVGEFIKVKVIDFDEETNHAKLSLKAIDNRYRRRNKRVYYKNPRRSIVETPNGFAPLAKAMEKWLKQGITEEN